MFLILFGSLSNDLIDELKAPLFVLHHQVAEKDIEVSLMDIK